MSISAASLILLSLALPTKTGPENLGETLNRIKTLATQKKAPVVVFDLDSTIFNNAPRTKQILLEMAAHDARLWKHYANLERLPDELPYRIDDVLKKAGVRGNDARLFSKGWMDRFFLNRYVVHDTPTPGAIYYINEARKRGATIVYLTGRNAPGMGPGTVESLVQNGFPVLEPDAILIMKPNKEMPDESFKRSAIGAVANIGTVVATFENEPRNANLFAQAWPGAMHFLLTTNSDPAKKANLSRSVQKVPNFKLPLQVSDKAKKRLQIRR